MFENILKFFKKMTRKEETQSNSKNTAKERLHLVLVQDRANVSADFLELMKQEIIEVIKKYIEVDENLIDVRLTNHGNEEGTTGAPALYANIPIKNIKEAARKNEKMKEDTKEKNEEKADKAVKEENKVVESDKQEKKAEDDKNNSDEKNLKKESEEQNDKTKKDENEDSQEENITKE